MPSALTSWKRRVLQVRLPAARTAAQLLVTARACGREAPGSLLKRNGLLVHG